MGQLASYIHIYYLVDKFWQNLTKFSTAKFVHHEFVYMNVFCLKFELKNMIYNVIDVVKMKFAISVWLVLCLLTTLITLSVQQCTKEEFEAGARELVLNSIGSEATILSPSDVFINETYYNCLATSENIGTYTFMSVSLTYTLSRAPNTLREIRYVMRCIGGAWNRLAENNTALKSNETRTDCYRCTDTANNEEYCFREL